MFLITKIIYNKQWPRNRNLKAIPKLFIYLFIQIVSIHHSPFTLRTSNKCKCIVHCVADDLEFSLSRICQWHCNKHATVRQGILQFFFLYKTIYIQRIQSDILWNELIKSEQITSTSIPYLCKKMNLNKNGKWNAMKRI